MLELHFVNVGDGDAIYVEQSRGVRTFRMLVDTGKENVSAAPGSERITAADYLKNRGVEYLDALVITHLHLDHFGGLRAIMDSVKIGTVFTGFVPEGMGHAPEKDSDIKSIRGLKECLNRWSADVDTLRRKGTRFCPIARQREEIALTRELRAVFYGPPEDGREFMSRVYGSLLRGEPVSDGLAYCISKLRNPFSLRLKLEYAGRGALLAGDCYGAGWEDVAEHCDLLKAPHHGDSKALTKRLISGLSPRWAVISCGEEYIPRKDRPSRQTLEMLADQGTRIYFTDAFAPDGCAPIRHKSVIFSIHEDGTVEAPA